MKIIIQLRKVKTLEEIKEANELFKNIEKQFIHNPLIYSMDMK